jgi:hypothetical protein
MAELQRLLAIISPSCGRLARKRENDGESTINSSNAASAATSLAVFAGAGLMHGAPVALIAIGPLGGLVLLMVRAGQLAAFTDDGSLTVRN